MRLLTVYGSPTPPGKLARGMDLAEESLRRYSGWECIRLAPSSPTGWPLDAEALVSEADAVLVASPVFRASFPAVLKQLFEQLPVAALRSTPVGLLTVAAAPQHALGAERHLRDVLSWFGALTAPGSSFFVDRTFAADPVDPEVRAELGELVDQLVVLATALPGTDLGPSPLAARRL